MGDYVRAIILGAIQALSEFLPISSSGHLLIAERIMGEGIGSLTFDVGLHTGTLAAVLVYFWRDWVEIIGAGLRDIAKHGARIDHWSGSGRLGLWIAAGTTPAVIVGLLFNDAIEAHTREALLVVFTLIGVGLLIDFLDRRGALDRGLASIGLGTAMVIGVAQACALVPGVSRSGITIGAARGLGIQRAAAARFSFLLSAPAVLGAAVLQLSEAVRSDEAFLWGPMLVGALTAAALGMLVIRGLLSFLQSRTLRVFLWYRIAVGLAVLVGVLTGQL
ncbi:MAG: undecaprenyl-diphosphate phosphatase [Dehalococcoidia bacterium]